LLHLTRPTLLVVESDATLCRLMAIMLGQDGYTVVPVNTSDEALAALAHHRLVGVVIGTLMAGLSGIELCRALRAHPETQRLPILVILATHDQNTLNRALVAGATDTLVKPIVATTLTAKVRQILR
jgi:two-component system phosphate regulon response regulator PhoB